MATSCGAHPRWPPRDLLVPFAKRSARRDAPCRVCRRVPFEFGIHRRRAGDSNKSQAQIEPPRRVIIRCDLKAYRQSRRGGLIHHRAHDRSSDAAAAQFRHDRLIDDQQSGLAAIDDNAADGTSVKLDDVKLCCRKFGAVAVRLGAELKPHELFHCRRRQRQRAQSRRPRLAEQTKAEVVIIATLVAPLQHANRRSNGRCLGHGLSAGRGKWGWNHIRNASNR